MELLQTAVYRKPAKKAPYAEQMFVLSGTDVHHYMWKWSSPTKQSPSKTKTHAHATAKLARKRYDAEVAALEASDWRPVVDWPGGAAKPAKPTKAAKAAKVRPMKPVPLAKLTITGRAPRATAAELATIERKHALPADYKELVRTHGARAFANHLRITKPAKIVADTKGFLKFWTVQHEPVWKNFAALVPDPKALVLLAASSNGDVVGHTADHYVIFPRSGNAAVKVPTLASVFGWFVAAIDAAGDTPALTYAPER